MNTQPAPEAGVLDDKEFYLQDTRQYLGNSMMWWGKERQGYTDNPTKAHVFTGKELREGGFDRDSDVAWPKEYIDSIITHCVDMQNADATEGVRPRLMPAPPKPPEPQKPAESEQSE